MNELTNLSGEIHSEILTFEDFKNENGIIYWWASDLSKMLGYASLKSFETVLGRATKAFVSLNIPHYENIIAILREINGVQIQDFKLTRFACYLITMNGDPKKREVAECQLYFVEQTRKFELYLHNNDELDRMLIREEIIEGNKSLASIAKKANVTDYGKFMNAGYLGMYNMENWKLAAKRNVRKEMLMESMDRAELAANLFRITQTEERIKSKNITGQQNLEQTHHDVGKEVRKIVKQNTSKLPENLEQVKELPEVKKQLKEGYKKMLKEDKPKKNQKNKK